jgi:hypothetical protein
LAIPFGKSNCQIHLAIRFDKLVSQIASGNSIRQFDLAKQIRLGVLIRRFDLAKRIPLGVSAIRFGKWTKIVAPVFWHKDLVGEQHWLQQLWWRARNLLL